MARHALAASAVLHCSTCALGHEPAPPRQWAIRDRVPRRQAGLFSGEGGAGKSILEMTQAVAHVAGKDWLGSTARKRAGDLYRLRGRRERIPPPLSRRSLAHYGVTVSGELIAGGLHVLCKFGEDAVLCAVNPRTGKVETTKLYDSFYEGAGDIKPIDISIDTLSRVFAGNEIDRVQVYAFATHMQRLAIVADALSPFCAPEPGGHRFRVGDFRFDGMARRISLSPLPQIGARD